jgi:uncharacterized protein GlcG (DUF336 family)
MLTMGVAQEISQEAIAKCRADYYKVWVMVVDSANVMKFLLRDDGEALATVESVSTSHSFTGPGLRGILQ